MAKVKIADTVKTLSEVIGATEKTVDLTLTSASGSTYTTQGIQKITLKVIDVELVEQVNRDTGEVTKKVAFEVKFPNGLKADVKVLGEDVIDADQVEFTNLVYGIAGNVVWFKADTAKAGK